MGLITLLFGCDDKSIKLDDGLIGAGYVPDHSINLTAGPGNKKTVITCDNFQEIVNIILWEGYKIKYIEKPIRKTSGTIISYDRSKSWIECCNYEINNIIIYENESNKDVYDYLCGKIRWIEAKKEWLKSQEPNPCLQDIDFENGGKERRIK